MLAVKLDLSAAESDPMRPIAPMPRPSGVTGSHVDLFDRIDQVDPEEWDAVVHRQRLPAFYSHTFLAAYERHPLTEIDGFRYLVIRRGGGAVAVLPAYLQRRPDPLGVLAEAFPEAAGEPALLSHSWHCYDAHAGEPALLPVVLGALRELAAGLGAPWYGLVNVERGGPLAAALLAAGLPVRHLVDRFRAELGGAGDVGEFLRRNARPRARLNLLRYRRRAAEHGVTSADVAVTDLDLAEVTALCDRSARKHGSDRFYPEGTFEAFLTMVAPISRAVEVRQRGRLVAVGVCLLDDSRLHCWACGVDYDVDGNFSPYHLMFADSVDLALRLGRPVLEGGRGNPGFKLRLGLTPRPLVGCLTHTDRVLTRV